MSKNKQLQPKTEGQKLYFKSIYENKITICMGPAGTGKTAIPSRMAAIELLAGHYERIVIMRPMVQAGENTGYLPGDINEKMDPYVRPIFDELRLYINQEQIKNYLFKQLIEIVPFAYARGRSFHNSFIIADELQNATYEQLVLALTRFGRDSKMVLTGDTDQSDLPKSQQGALQYIAKAIGAINNIGIINLERSDIFREPIIFNILCALNKENSPENPVT